MDDLISRKALIADLRTAKGLGAIVAETLVRFVKKQPTVEAVEVVRCKDCKHRYAPNSEKCRPFCTKQFGMDARDDDFCSYGERREGE